MNLLSSGGKNLKKGTKFRFTLLVKSGTVTLSVDGRSRQRADRVIVCHVCDQ